MVIIPYKLTIPYNIKSSYDVQVYLWSDIVSVCLYKVHSMTLHDISHRLSKNFIFSLVEITV